MRRLVQKQVRSTAVVCGSLAFLHGVVIHVLTRAGHCKLSAMLADHRTLLRCQVVLELAEFPYTFCDPLILTVEGMIMRHRSE